MTGGGLIAITSRWLVGALVLDLAVTRVALRLAIFLPKSAGVADIVAALARLAAVVENLVPLAALLVLGALMAEAGRRTETAWKGGLVLAAAVGIGGLVLRWAVPSPATTGVQDSLAVGAALLLVVPAARAARRDLYAVAVAALAGAAALPAIGALMGWGAVAAQTTGAPGLVLVLSTLGGVAFLVGVALVTTLGIVSASRSGGGIGAVGPRWVAAGSSVGIVLGVAALAAPQMTGLLLIWGIGLPSLLLPPLYGIGAGLAVIGLRGAWLVRPRLATGVAVAALAGYGLASSGLVLAGLIGIALSAGAFGAAVETPAATRRVAAIPSGA